LSCDSCVGGVALNICWCSPCLQDINEDADSDEELEALLASAEQQQQRFLPGHLLPGHATAAVTEVSGSQQRSTQPSNSLAQ